MLNGAQVLGIHDVAAVLVLKHRHQFAWPLWVLDQRRVLLPALCHVLRRDQIATGVSAGRVGPVVPATGVGTGALIGVAPVEVARQQTASGIGDAQGTVNEGLDLQGRALGTDLGDFLKRQLTRQDHPGDPLGLPEASRRVIDHVGLHRQMDHLVRPTLTHHHDQARVGHDQRIRPRLDDRCHVLQVGPELGIVRSDIGGHVEALATRLGLSDASSQVVEAEVIVAHTQ